MAESVDGRSEVGSEAGKEKQENIGKVDVFLLGVTAMLSGQVTAWAAATANGFWVMLASTLIPTVGYLILTFCVAEMTSALPFSGGIYGFVRAFSSPLLGFIVAMFEIIVNLCYVSPTVYLLASIPSDYYNVSQSFKLPLCLIIYIALDVILLAGGTLFWQFNRYLGLLVLVLFVTYIIGSATYADFDKWGKGDEFDVPQLFQDLPLVSTVYLGIQLLPLSSRLTSKPKKDVPIAMNTMMESISASIDGYPLTDGFTRIFNISYNAATCLNIPALVATSLGFLYFSARQTHCMAKSGLIHAVFKKVIPSRDTPYAALIGFSMMSFVLNIVTHFYTELVNYFDLVTSLSSFIVFISALIAYITFHKKYSVLERYFASPLGVIGAYVGILIFLLCFVGGMAFQDSYIPGTMVIAVAVISALYFIFFSKGQTFSEEEKDELFKAYLVNANVAAKNKIRRRGQVAPALRANNNRVSKDTQITNMGNDGTSSSDLVKQQIEGEEEVKGISIHKSNHLCAPENTCKSPRKRRLSEMSRHSLSERVIQYVSSKMNQISPDPEQQLAILQAGTSINLDEEGNVNNV